MKSSDYSIDNITWINKKSIFRNQLNEFAVVNRSYDGLIGHGVGFSRKSAKVAIGEYSERIACFSSKSKDSFSGIQLSTGIQFAIPNNRVLFSQGSGTDSSGLASHMTSKKALSAASLEFFERQSLIEHWITQQPGKKFELSLIENLNDVYFNILKKYFETINIYEISVFQKVSVVICIATSQTKKAIGIGAGWSTKLAVERCLSEACEGLPGKSILYSPSVPTKNPNISSVLQEADGNNSAYQALTPQQLQTVYSFLDEKILVTEKDLVRSISPRIDQICALAENDFQIIICMVRVRPALFERIKIVKVLSLLGGYPHMQIPQLKLNDNSVYADCRIIQTHYLPFP